MALHLNGIAKEIEFITILNYKLKNSTWKNDSIYPSTQFRNPWLFYVQHCYVPETSDEC